MLRVLQGLPVVVPFPAFIDGLDTMTMILIVTCEGNSLTIHRSDHTIWRLTREVAQGSRSPPEERDMCMRTGLSFRRG